jgi:hypothetical protein
MVGMGRKKTHWVFGASNKSMFESKGKSYISEISRFCGRIFDNDSRFIKADANLCEQSLYDAVLKKHFRSLALTKGCSFDTE